VGEESPRPPGVGRRPIVRRKAPDAGTASGPFSKIPHPDNPLFKDGVRIKEPKSDHDWARTMVNCVVFWDKRLTDDEARFYGLLMKWKNNHTSEVHLSMRWMANRLGVHYNTVRRRVAALVRYGYLVPLQIRRGSEKKRSIYYLECRATRLRKSHDILGVGTDKK
jgi:hypothetical protein